MAKNQEPNLHPEKYKVKPLAIERWNKYFYNVLFVCALLKVFLGSTISFFLGNL
jgi:hypothetical protein